ncbi:NAD(P)-dependent oxidoreductase [Geomicrobium sediminis]|uniref:Phosphoglycerate dehydrogenase-like enzyme n=1 Tax=Geomicrobium sediminis TaxID=1347788 RepID=A0ABS2PHB5_9BACL|nr:phosphoglycerate dehydrogenase-like enzyme [Geomicrobium sediminis]
MEVVITNKIPTETIREIKEQLPSVNISQFETMSEAKEKLESADALFLFGGGLTERVISSAVNLKWVMTSSAGVENLPLDSLEKRGITVTNARGVHNVQMGEYALHAMLDHARKHKVSVEYQQIKRFENFKPGELYGKTLVILGTGAIAQAVAKRANVFGMRVFGINQSGREVVHFDETYALQELFNVLPKADYIVNVLPSTSKTKQLINEESFSYMKHSAVFINFGRGDAVNEQALIEALRNKRLDHAYLDVFEEEPLHEEHPLWGMDEVTITPHIAGYSSHYMERLLPIFVHNLRVFVEQEGEMKNIVNKSEGY